MSNRPFASLRLSALVLALAAAPLAACGGDDDEATAGEFFGTFIDTLCGSAFECETLFPSDLGVSHEDIFGADVAACKTQFITATQVQSSVDAGRVTYDASAGATCVSKLEDLDCAGFWNAFTTSLPAECDVAIVGAVATGGTCELSLDCMTAGDSCDAGSGTCTGE